MNKAILNKILVVIGFLGMIIISVTATMESKTANIGSLISCIPLCILFASMFIVGYISLNKQ